MTQASMIPKFPICVRLPVQWGEMDAFQHVNNVIYFRWFETARIQLFQALNLTQINHLGPILAHTDCQFLAPLTWPDEVLVGVRVSKIGTKSFTTEYQVSRASQPDQAVARGSGVVVLYDYKNECSAPLSDAHRLALQAYLFSS